MLIAKVRLDVRKVVLTRLLEAAKRLISCASSGGLLQSQWHPTRLQGVALSATLRTGWTSSRRGGIVHVYGKLCEHLLQTRASAEAVEWIESALGPMPRTIGSFDADDTRYVIGNVLARGAVRARVIGDPDVIHSYGSADALLIDLPQDPALRNSLFELENQITNETGFDATLDEGQHYLFIRWR